MFIEISLFDKENDEQIVIIKNDIKEEKAIPKSIKRKELAKQIITIDGQIITE